jgi:hypothetical protein
MKTINRILNLVPMIVIAILVVIGYSCAHAAEAKSGPSVGLEPYGTINWRGLNGEADLGAGVNLSLEISKGLSLVAFAEGDSTKDPNFFDQIDRAGAGLRYTVWLGKRASLDGGVAGAYDIANENFFLRLPLGASLYAIKTEKLSAGLRAQYAFDISGNGKTGTASGIASVGPFVDFSF